MPPSRSDGNRSLVVFAAAALLLFLLLRVPSHPDEFTLGQLAHWPLEIPLALLLLLVLPRRAAIVFRSLLIAGLLLLVLLRLADLGSRLAFGRAFSPLAEWHLIGQGWSLVANAAGLGEALAVLAVVAAVLVVTTLLLYRGLGRADRIAAPTRRWMGRAMLVLLMLGGVAWSVPRAGGPDLGVRADVVAEFATRIDRTRRAVEDQTRFAAELAADPVPSRPPPSFAGLAGRDVIVLFVESYGRSWLDAPRFADESTRTLRGLGRTLDAAGLAVTSGWVDSPIRGGRSWLAQATLASGMTLSDQARFDRLVTSDRRSLHTLFGAAGWRTAVVLPIVDGEWHEGAWYRPDHFLDGPALGYRGEDFGYVPMPDQYTLAAFERALRMPHAQPLFATIGLLGSHAPWTPLALPVPWDSVGDGHVFDGSHRVGGALSWSDPEPVRNMYGRSLTLTLERVGEYLARHAGDALVLIVGDHQPADVIAGWAPNAHVPMHVVSRDRELLAGFSPAGFVDGTIPDDGAPALPMAGIREWLGTAFETSGPPPGRTAAPIVQSP